MNWIEQMVDADFHVFAFYTFVLSFLVVYGILLVSA